MDAPFNSSSPQPKSIFSAEGRIGRMTYFAWLFMLGIVSALGSFILQLSLNACLGNGPNSIFIQFLTSSIFLCIILYLTTIFTIRRLHDRNHTGWFSLILLIPWIGSLFHIYITFSKGDEMTNSFGPSRSTKKWEKVVFWIGVIIAVLTLICALVYVTICLKSILEASQSILDPLHHIQQNISQESSPVE